MTRTHQQKIELNGQIRTVLGSKVKTIRKSGFVPAVLYGKGQPSLSLQVPVKDFNRALKSAGESTLVYLTVEGEAYPTIIHDVARSAVDDTILHADFYKVNLSEKIKTEVPIVFTGESDAVKEGGILIRSINELEVEALPQNLPHELTIDISVLKQFGDKITIGDLKKGLGNLASLTAEDDEAIIATVQEPISEEELKASLETPVAGVEDVEVIKPEKEEEVVEEEGEAPAEPKAEPSKE